MPFPMKIQPIGDADLIVSDQSKPAVKSRLKRLFEWRRISSSEKLAGDAKDRDFGGDLDPSSVVLDKMVRNFMEDNEKSRNHRCNCFQGNCEESDDDNLDFAARDIPIVSPPDAADVLKGLVVCASVTERNLLADASSIVENIKNSKCKERQKMLADGLRSLGYDASICKSRWEKSPSYPAGEHDYIDVIVEGGDRILIDVDFRSEFEIARSTKSYRALLQSLPSIFVGTADRVSQIISVVSEAAKQSLQKKGLHFPPWRKPEYMRSKWLAPFEREPRGALSAIGADDEAEAKGVEREVVVVMCQLPAARPTVMTGFALVP